MDNDSFYQGLLLGLDTALVCVDQGGRSKIIETRDDLRDKIDRLKRGPGGGPDRPAVVHDFMLPEPLAAAGDFGMPSDFRVSRVVIKRAPATVVAA